jgi:hypothetical protein
VGGCPARLPPTWKHEHKLVQVVPHTLFRLRHNQRQQPLACSGAALAEWQQAGLPCHVHVCAQQPHCLHARLLTHMHGVGSHLARCARHPVLVARSGWAVAASWARRAVQGKEAYQLRSVAGAQAPGPSHGAPPLQVPPRHCRPAGERGQGTKDEISAQNMLMPSAIQSSTPARQPTE